MVTDPWLADLRRYAGQGIKVPTFGRLASDGFQNTLFVALEGEADRLQVALGGLAGSPEEGYL